MGNRFSVSHLEALWHGLYAGILGGRRLVVGGTWPSPASRATPRSPSWRRGPYRVLPPQERTGVKMVMIQDGPLPTGADKPLRITGDPFKVQVGKTP